MAGLLSGFGPRRLAGWPSAWSVWLLSDSHDRRTSGFLVDIIIGTVGVGVGVGEEFEEIRAKRRGFNSGL